ncbi:hypothetical protein AnigIFM63604_003297 [Aspergillus niger]|uniref:Uncharacterized protein n=1 Tax=Aspergillus niger TaxID=5061 RepID=A0A9W6ACU0_ASPNG|nr:hypothetical protein AnigIFM63604_003297 [Aspergillus niger]
MSANAIPKSHVWVDLHGLVFFDDDDDRVFIILWPQRMDATRNRENVSASSTVRLSLTRTKPGIEIAMRKVQDDRLNWEHDMIAKLGDFLIEEVDQQLQDTRSKGSCWYMKSTYNDIPIRAVGHLQRDGPVAKVLP